MLSWLFKREDQSAAFWTWFQENEGNLWNVFDTDDALFAELGARLHRVDAGLVFECGPLLDGRRNFVVSANGVVNLFPAVTALVGKAPEIERWRIVAFRQPGGSALRIEMPTGFTLDAGSVSIALNGQAEKPGVTVFLPGYADDPEHIRLAYISAGFLFLDNALGEYTVATELGPILFQPLHACRGVETISLAQLTDHFREISPNGNPA